MHTLGTLLEDARYKAALNKGDIGALVRVAVDGFTKGGNPLAEKSPKGGYDELNRDAGACSTYFMLSFMLIALGICSTPCM